VTGPDIVTALVALVRGRDYVSFVEAARELEVLGVPCAGDLALYLGDDDNLIVWAGMSMPFLNAVIAAREDGLVRFEPSSHLTYLIDGCTQRLPIARHPPAGGYKSPHWLPVVMRLGPTSPPRRRSAPTMPGGIP
jgi:hypothetical protein